MSSTHGHHHHSHHGHHHHHEEGKNILLAFILNLVFSIIEFIGGYLTNSVAIYSDALHDLGDSMSLLLSYFAEKLSIKKPDEIYNFGHRRFSILSALFNGIVLFIGSLYIIYEAIQRMMSPEPLHAPGMLGLAILGISINSFAAYRLSKNTGINSKMVMFHLIEDILGWLGILIVSAVLLFKPWYILDSIMSVLISIIILRGVYKNLIEVFHILLQRFPDQLELSDIKSTIQKMDLVQDIHAIRGWSIDSNSYSLNFHIKVSSKTTMDQVDSLKFQIKNVLKEHNIIDSTIEFESHTCSI